MQGESPQHFRRTQSHTPSVDSGLTIGSTARQVRGPCELLGPCLCTHDWHLFVLSTPYRSECSKDGFHCTIHLLPAGGTSSSYV